MTDPAPPLPKHTPAREHLIVALDFPDAARALSLADQLGNSILWYKVGLELYLAAGNGIVATLIERGHSVFLDLKLHDIPNTVSGAVRSAAQSGASLLTVHASGGPAMIAAAAEAAVRLKDPPQLLAVTVLTSMDQTQLIATGIERPSAAQVELLADMALQAGANGLVCSAEESAALRETFGHEPLLVIPGIRTAGAAIGDQKRIATPASALQNGASYLVVGRPITQVPDPKLAAESILDEMDTVLTSSARIQA